MHRILDTANAVKELVIMFVLCYRLLVGAPYYSQPSNEGTIQRTGSIFSCSLVNDMCELLGQNNSFYTFNGKCVHHIYIMLCVVQMISLLLIMALISC